MHGPITGSREIARWNAIGRALEWEMGGRWNARWAGALEQEEQRAGVVGARLRNGRAGWSRRSREPGAAGAAGAVGRAGCGSSWQERELYASKEAARGEAIAGRQEAQRAASDVFREEWKKVQKKRGPGARKRQREQVRINQDPMSIEAVMG